MITEKLQKSLNDQIVAELWSSNLYLSMSFFAARRGYPGMASWFKKQSVDEREHACSMANYMIGRNCAPKLDKIDVVPNDFGTPLEMFKQVYEHECRVSKMINSILDMAIAEKDKATQDFLWQFVREQVAEENTTLAIVDMLKNVGEGNIYSVDDRLKV